MTLTDLKVIEDIRVFLLHYWKEEKDIALKEELSAKMNAIDDIINGQRKIIAERNKFLGG